MGLPGIVRGKKRPPRMVLYGPPKVGKSTFGADALAPVFVTTEEGVDNLPVDQYPMAGSWQELLANLQAVADGEHEYKTIVLDTLNGVAELCAQHVCAARFKNDWGPGGFASYGQGWAATSEEFRRLLPPLDKCRARGMIVILLAHTGVVSIKNPGGGDYQKFAPDVDKRLWARVSAWADIISRADYDYAITKDKEGRSRVVGDSTRVMISQGSVVEDAGTRVGYHLPTKMPLSWSAFIEHMGKDDDSAELVKTGWEKLEPEKRTKALGYLGIKSIEDINTASSAKLRVLANRMKEHDNDK